MFACGSSSCAQLGIGVGETVCFNQFHNISFFDTFNILSIRSGREHTQVLVQKKDTKSTLLYSFGCNDLGELGRMTECTTKPAPVDFKLSEVDQIVDCFVGASHNLALSQNGLVCSWGANTDLQTGLEDHEADVDGIFSLPKPIKFPEKERIVSVATGSKHCIALNSHGNVFVWGSNCCGQLGAGKVTESLKFPTLVNGIYGLPVTKVAAGGFHSILITVSGRVFVCGKNNKGQLGLGDTSDKYILCRVMSLKPFFVLKAAGGELHTIFMCSKLEKCTTDSQPPQVFLMSCGGGENGQLGFSNITNAPVVEPRALSFISDSVVVDVSCGRKHSLCLTEKGTVYSFGLNNAGQLGLCHFNDVSEPTRVENLPPEVGYISAGGDQSFCVLKSSLGSLDDDDSCSHKVLHINTKFVSTFLSNPNTAEQLYGGSEKVAQLLKNVFENSACLNSSFLHNYPSYQCQSSSMESAVNVESLVDFFTTLSELYKSSYNRAITSAIESLVSTTVKNVADFECLRMYFILSQCYVFDAQSNWKSVIIPFALSFLKLTEPALKTLKYWLKNSDYRVLGRLLSIYKELIKYITLNSYKSGKKFLNDEQAVKALMVSLRMLEFVHSVNKMKEAPNQLPPNRFYVKELTSRLDIENDYVVWLQKKSNAENAKCKAISTLSDPYKVVPVCDFPFVFDVASKSALLACEAMLKMQRVVTELQFRSLLTSDFAQHCPFLILFINRNNLIDSTLKQLLACDEFDLRKPLKVIFQGEDAVDAGGVKKEFFMLVLKEILDIKYGMFKIVGNVKWFNSLIGEELRLFKMIGMICGLAIYNYTIIDLMFPIVLYKKLLSLEVDLYDLYSLDPDLAKQLQSLLDYEADDLEDVFCLNFQIVTDFYGTVITHDLIPNGGEVPVNQDNKHMYVSTYVDYILNKSIQKQYYEFSTGFFKVVKSDVLSFFQPQELHELISGCQNYDFHELENSTTYKDEYSAEHPVIRNFWKVIHEMPLELQLKFLLFLSGTERVPVNGMKSLNFTIQPTHGGENYLPVAHTCFNLLDLPLYSDIETLRNKLLLAIEQTEGFALV